MKYLSICLLIPLISACGVHVTSDPVKVEHTFSINMEAIIKYCDDKYPNDDYGFQQCVKQFADLFQFPS